MEHPVSPRPGEPPVRLVARRLRHEAGGRRILSDVSLAAEDGELIALLGPSGSGKSTLLDALNGFRPVQGTVRVNGRDLYRDFDHFRRWIGYVPQDDVIHRALTVESVLTYAARLRLPGAPDGAIRSTVRRVLGDTGLSGRRDVRVRRLSGGQRKRVSLGVELVAAPRLLFLDEPTSGLDPALETQMMQLFRRLTTAGRLTLVTTHVMESVRLVDLIWVLAAGQLVFAGTPDEALGYFEVTEHTAIYDRLEQASPQSFRERFESSPLHQRYISARIGA